MITVKKLTDNKEMETFVKFPFTLYKNNKYWVPPIIKDELETLNKDINPAFESAEVDFYLALKNNKVVGRIAVIINKYEVETQLIKKIRFGWFDFIDDLDVSKALLEKVYETGKNHGLEFAEGPIGFSNLDKVGVLTYGFDELGTMITWYNHPYYKDHFEAHGFVVGKEYYESKFHMKNIKPDFFQRAEKLIRTRFELTPVNFTSAKEIMPYVDEMFDLFNKTYSVLSSFIPISEKQKQYFKNKYISFINPEYIKFVVDKNNKIVAFSIVMPSFSKALQKAKGKLFPFGFLHLLNAKKHSTDVIFYLIGIDPEYQNKGVTAIIFNEYFKVFENSKVENYIRTPELSDNVAIRQLWKNFDPVVHAKRCTYVKDI